MSELKIETTVPGNAPAHYWIDETGIDIAGRTIWLVGELTEEDADWFAKAVRVMVDQSANTPIIVMLNTPGGDVTAMFAIHDLIRSSPCNIRVIAYGEVVSAGVLLLTCGHRRMVSESCVLMSHEPTVGDESDLGLRAAKDRRAWEDWTHTHWCELMARYTPQDAAWWKRKTERKAEYWLLGGQSIVDAGLADGVWR